MITKLRMEEIVMSEVEKELFFEIYQSGLSLDQLVKCLDMFVFDHLPGKDVSMQDINALHGLVAAFVALSKTHVENIIALNEKH